MLGELEISRLIYDKARISTNVTILCDLLQKIPFKNYQRFSRANVLRDSVAEKPNMIYRFVIWHDDIARFTISCYVPCAVPLIHKSSVDPILKGDFSIRSADCFKVILYGSKNSACHKPVVLNLWYARAFYWYATNLRILIESNRIKLYFVGILWCFCNNTFELIFFFDINVIN